MLEANSPKVKFHDTMAKTKLKTFSDMNKIVKLRKVSTKKILLQAERALFTQML